jgi:hypothetical protein
VKSDLADLVAGLVLASVQEKAAALDILGLTAVAERDRHGMVTGRLILHGSEGGRPRRLVVAVEDARQEEP